MSGTLTPLRGPSEKKTTAPDPKPGPDVKKPKKKGK